MTGEWLTGVWLFIVPLDGNEGAKGRALLESRSRPLLPSWPRSRASHTANG